MASARSRRIVRRKRRKRYRLGLGTSLACKACDRIYVVCHPCYKGHKYCSQRCRERSRREQLNAASRRYASTTKGREMARIRQARRRAQNRTNVSDSPTVTHYQEHGELTGRQDVSKSAMAHVQQHTGYYAFGSQIGLKSATFSLRRPFRVRPAPKTCSRRCSACRSKVSWLLAVPRDIRLEWRLRHLGQSRGTSRNR